MSSGLFERMHALFGAVLEQPLAEQAAFLERACAGDQQLLDGVRKLLAMDAQLQGTTVQPLGLQRLVADISAASLEGLLVGPYRVRESLGQGGMGSVHRAERSDGVISQQVAVKFVRRELLGEQTLRRFQFERQTLAGLDHPSIARLIDAAELPDGTPYFVMEYVDGVPLNDYCERTHLGLRERLQLFKKVCVAVSHAHRKLVVHRDLKPGNILVTAAGEPKLLDFGIAKSLDTQHSEQTGTAHRFFSPRYAAPEQLLGGDIGVGCDVYALGLLLYELLAGVAPFELDGLTASQIERLITAVPPPAPSARAVAGSALSTANQAVRADLDGILLKSLRKEPVQRYASVEQLEQDLGRFLAGQPVHARNGHAWYRLRKFVGRNRWAVSAAGVAVLALASALAILLQQNAALTQERDLSRQSLAILTDAFLAADPLRAAGADASARSILDAARARIDASFDTQPGLYVSLAQSIAEVDLSLGQAREAAALLERAISASARAGSTSMQQQRLLIQHALALQALNMPEAADRQLEAARLLSPTLPVEWSIARGRLLAARREPAAIQLLTDSLEHIAALPPTVELANRTRLALAEAHRMNGDDAGALAVLDRTLAWQRESLEDAHPQIVRTRIRRIEPLRILGRLEEALSEGQRLVADIEKTYGADTAANAYAQSTLGIALDTAGRASEARDTYRKSVHAWEQSLGPDHPNTVRAKFNLALGLQAQVADEAEALFRDCLESTARMRGPQSEMTVYYRLFFGKFLHKAGRHADALVLLAEAANRPGLDTLAADNRIDYRDTLRSVHASAGCATAEAGGSSSLMPACLTAANWLDTLQQTIDSLENRQ